MEKVNDLLVKNKPFPVVMSGTDESHGNTAEYDTGGNAETDAQGISAIFQYGREIALNHGVHRIIE